MKKINIQYTSDPTIIKLETEDFLVKGSYEFHNIDEAKTSPLAQQLFYLPFIKTVYIASNFIALERYSIVEWEEVAQEVAQQVEAYLNAGGVVVQEPEQNKAKVAVTVYAESTPNPAVMKFVTNKKIANRVYEFQSIDQTQDAPLAMALFHSPFVKEVFFDGNYVSVTKYDLVSWEEILTQVRELIRDHIAQGKEILKEKPAPTPTQWQGEAQRIHQILEEYVRPAVAGDGGNIELIAYDEPKQTVRVQLQGACSGCPSSRITLKNGIETMLREMLQNPAIEVEAVNA